MRKRNIYNVTTPVVDQSHLEEYRQVESNLADVLIILLNSLVH